MLQASGIHFHYDNQVDILSDISFTLTEGDIIALLGPSGCGKSTLLRIIAGLLKNQEGILHWKTDPTIGFVFQEPSLMPWATVSENVALPQKIKGTIDTRLIAEALNKVDMSAFSNRYPGQLSGGQKMRVSIARALASRPSVLLLDEPFAALDEMLRFQMNELLLSLRESLNLPILFVTHSVYEACYLADKVLVMSEGKISDDYTPNINRTLPQREQRASANYMNAVTSVSSLLAKGRE